MVYAMINVLSDGIFTPDCFIIKVIEKHKNGRYTVSFPKIQKINDYLDEYDFTNIKRQKIICKKEDISYMPEDFNDMIKFNLPILVKYLGIKTIYNNNDNYIIGIKNYIDFEQIDNKLFLYNMGLYTKNTLKIYDMNKMLYDYDPHTNANRLSKYWHIKFKKLKKDTNNLGNEIFNYMYNNMEHYLLFNGYLFPCMPYYY
jgi:hypothetical protein